MMGEFVCLSKGDIIRYLRVRLGQDEILDGIDESMEAEILRETPQSIL